MNIQQSQIFDFSLIMSNDNHDNQIINYEINGMTPLMDAINRKDVDGAIMILKHPNINVNIVNIHNKCALDYALEPIVKFCIKYANVGNFVSSYEQMVMEILKCKNCVYTSDHVIRIIDYALFCEAFYFVNNSKNILGLIFEKIQADNFVLTKNDTKKIYDNFMHRNLHFYMSISYYDGIEPFLLTKSNHQNDDLVMTRKIICNDNLWKNYETCRDVLRVIYYNEFDCVTKDFVDIFINEFMFVINDVYISMPIDYYILTIAIDRNVIDVNYVTKNGNTIIHSLLSDAYHENTRITDKMRHYYHNFARLCVRQDNCDINKKNDADESYLYLASKNGDIDIVNILLKKDKICLE